MELYLDWKRGQWQLVTPRGKHKEEIVRCYDMKAPLPVIIEAAKKLAATYPEGATLTIVRGKGWRNQETIEYPPHQQAPERKKE